MSFKLTLNFETDEDRHDFLGWLLDGGGEYQYNDLRESDEKPRLDFGPPKGLDTWEWLEPGLESNGAYRTEPLPQYSIDCAPYDDEDSE
jgi:hypothetical protein